MSGNLHLYESHLLLAHRRARGAGLAIAQKPAHLPQPISSRRAAPMRLTEEHRALHALNRLTFGPRPGDLQKVMVMDVDDWIEQQLHPDEINHNTLDAKLAHSVPLRMQIRDLVQMFPNNNLLKSAADGKTPLPTDPMKPAIYEVQISMREDRQKQDQMARDARLQTLT
jgi:Protein of unknown function (DUF1800)